MALSRNDRIDTWLRGQGLPYLVPRHRRGHDLLQRTAPAVVLMTAPLLLRLFTGAALADAFDGVGEAVGSVSTLVALLILALAVLLPALGAWWLHRGLVRWSDPRGRTVALVLGLVFVGAMVAVEALERGSVLRGVLDGFFTLAVLHALAWSGVGSLVAWAARWAVRSLRAVQDMASRALPVILVLVVFAFFSTEPWQIADHMGSARQALLTGVIALIAVLAMLPVARAEVTSAHRDLTEEQAGRLLAGTPLAGAPTGDVSGAALTRGGRLNVIAVLVLAHLIQAAMFTLVIATLLVTIGRIAVTDTVVRVWLGHPREPYRFLGDPLPLDHQTVHAAFLLGVIGALSFVLTSLSDPTYRSMFFDPLVERVKVAVAAHRALAGQGRHGKPDR